jgi:hypothetical protein
MIEQKQFANGGLNQDVDENFLKPNEWTNALNIRNTDRLEGSDGVISNIKGNTLVTFTLPSGTNRCIGAYANETTGKYYSFIYNSDGFHTITEYDPTTNILTKVLQSKTDTGGTDILNFQQYELINGVGIVGGTLLYWTDGYNPPRNIDIAKAKLTSGWYTTSASISLIKRPPQKLIIPSYGNDTNTQTSSNRLKNQLFQFRYLYVYQDNTRSTWSSCSVLPYPELEISSGVDTTPFKNNNILLQFDIGDKYVKSIEIAALVKGVGTTGTTQDWFSILTVDRDYILASPGSTEYLYDAITNNATYKFRNDGLYPSVDIQEIDLQYDFVPLKSKCLDIVNGNVLVIGNNTEGYDNLPATGAGSLNVNFNITYVPPDIDPLTSASDPTGLAFILSGVPVGDGFFGSSDTISATWDVYGNPKFFGPYLVDAEYSGSLYDFAVAAGQQLALNSSGIFGDPSNYYVYSATQQLGPNTVRVTFTKVGNPTNLLVSVTNTTALNNSSPAYKTNSKYQIGLVYYDEFNRSSYVQTNERALSGSNGGCILATSAWGAAAGQTPSIDWTINHSAPTWASKYQWVRTEQLTHKDFLFWAASSVTVNPNNANLYNLGIGSLNTFNNSNNNSILSYQYSEGDRCTIHSDDSGWISGYDVGVTNYDTTTGILTIQKGANLSAAVSSILLEVYTPKIRQNTTQDRFFYEFGEVYSCSGGVHAVTSGTFGEGDVYDKTRQIAGSGYVLEDPNFSDFYVSNFSSNGRVNIFAPQAKQLTLPTDIRFSDTYVPNTNINGLSRFYGDAFETYDRVNGSIQKLAVRDNYLMTFQELKTGYIPILQSIIEDQGAGNAANVAISNKLLNKIRYFPGDYGIGTHPESFARFAGTMYFADPNRSEILKLTQGLQPISKIGMDSYFTSKLSYTNNITNAKVLGNYDPRNDEYIISFKYPSPTNQFPGNNQTIAFSEDINRWTSFYSFIPDFGGYIFNQFITYQNGTMWTQNTNDYYGSFYGTAWTSSVDIVYNGSPSLIKTFIGVMEQASTVWTPVNIDTSTLQVSELPQSSFSLKEGVYFASLLREKTGDIRSLYFGNDLKGNWIKLYLAMGSNAKQTLLSVDVRHIPSYQGIK